MAKRHHITKPITKTTTYIDTAPPEPKEYSHIQRGGSPMNPLLFDLLTQTSPHGSEENIRKIILGWLERHGSSNPWLVDEVGNLMITVGDTTKHRTMFSCHMDTVHRKEEKNLLWLSSVGYVYATSNEKDHEKRTKAILGADDKVGCYLMARMIAEHIPGWYVFHVGEEHGGVGSAALVKSHEVEIDGKFDRCIALDRKGHSNIITKQAAGVCCSDKFASALAKELKDKSKAMYVNFKGDPTGTFTDSSNYRKLIPECTNLSVGYFDQHSRDETFDLTWVENILLPTLLKVDWYTLPVERDHKKVETYKSSYGGGFWDRDRSNYNHVQGGYWKKGTYYREESDWDNDSLYGYDKNTPYPYEKKEDKSTTQIYSNSQQGFGNWELDDGNLDESGHPLRAYQLRYKIKDWVNRYKHNPQVMTTKIMKQILDHDMVIDAHYESCGKVATLNREVDELKKKIKILEAQLQVTSNIQVVLNDGEKSSPGDEGVKSQTGSVPITEKP